MKDVLRYEGKRAIVTGAASGVGASVAALLVELGAEVHALDVHQPATKGLASYTECDLRDPDQIDAAVARIGKVVNALFNCAPAPTSSDLDVVLVTFCGARHLTERVLPNMVQGAAVVTTVTSVETDDPAAHALVETTDFAAGRAWCEANPELLDDAPRVSDQAIAAYTAARARTLAPDDIRINCVASAPSDEAVWPLVFLNSPRASPVTGQRLAVAGS